MLAALNEKKKKIIKTSYKSSILLKKNIISYYFVFFFSLIIILMAGIRWEVGTDWPAFLNDFNYFKSSTWNEILHSVYGVTYERGYVFTAFLFAKYVGNYSVYLTFQIIFIVICVFPVIYKYSEYPLFSFLGFFAYSFCYAFSVARSGFALALSFRAFEALLEKKNKIFFWLVLLATLFHNTAIVILLFPLLNKIKLTNVELLILICCALFFSFFTEKILLGIASNILPVSYSNRIVTYFNHRNETYGLNVGESVRIITRGFVVLLIFLCLWKRRNNNRINFIVNMYLLCILLYISFSRISVAFIRLCYYFEDVSQFLIFSEVLVYCKKKYIRMYVKLMIVLFFIGKFVSRIIGGNFIIPYRTIF
ncbi:EpsG family protein [Treponema bryantii]|uniref:EpsG family protein n=1 Tax=Treponema bryantii TaxID=163 RepID=UPI0018CB45EF|nr:EpsG family protein [Treponema bryantii]